jgi:hypothetical protein
MLSDFHVHKLDPTDKEKVITVPGTVKDCPECTPRTPVIEEDDDDPTWKAKGWSKPGRKPKSVTEEE